jgi:Ser/Thr protein kinase RdoA (MazF antagonist)
VSTRTFDLLSPQLVLSAVERCYGLSLDGTLTAYSSYVNRVYGLRDEDGTRYVAKFYRPGRWSREAIMEEHRFVQDCAERELPVVSPIADVEGSTLACLTAVDQQAREVFLFSLTPLRAGRGFDAEGPDEWLRLGALVGRVHSVAAGRAAVHRLRCDPREHMGRFAQELATDGVVHPDCRTELSALVDEALDLFTPRFDGVAVHRIHGDCHRGNILDRPGEGLLLIDFDDMMVGPPVQDLWLLLPDHASSCRRELQLVLEGYERFLPLDRGTLGLIEPLRFMRMVSYLAWQARQRDDARFQAENPAWGTRSFWILANEDLRAQLEIARTEDGSAP